MKKMYFKFLSLLLLAFFAIAAHAQTIITGTVKDASGPFPGANVSVKGTQRSTQTDANGKFSISASSNDVLVFSAVGFLRQEVTVGSDKNFNISLKEDSKSLEEVTVSTGFGVKQQTRKLSYSIQEVKGEDLVRANEQNIVNALQGKVAGVMINQGSGGPQSSSRIRIRGNSSLSANTQPLVVIDGVLIQPGVSGADSYGNSPQDFGNIMKNLNADDYESITVLKGAAASSLYGSKAQNGVLLITSKKGKGGQGLGISFSHTQTIEEAYKTMDLQNEFGAGINPTFTKDASGTPVIDAANYFWSFGPRFDGSQVKDIDGRMISWNAQPNNLLDAYKLGNYSNSNLAFQGGNETGTFRLSYSKLYSTGILPNNKFERDALDFRGSQKFGKIFEINAGVNYTVSNSFNPINQSNNNNPLFALVYGNPRSYDTNYWKNKYIDPANGGVLTGNNDPYGLSPLWFNIYETNVRQRENNFRGNIDVKANITPWLNALVRGTLNQINITGETKNIGSGVGFAGGEYALSQSNQKSSRLQFLLNGSKKLSDNFDFNMSLGAETTKDFGNNYTRTRTDGGLKDPGKFFMGNSVNAQVTNTSLDGSQRTDAVYGFGDLTYKNMLTLNFSVRNDWSSTLTYPDGHGDYSYTYPAAGISYVFSESLKNTTAFGFLSYGKLRVNYGYTGLGTNPYATSAGKYQFIGTYTDETGRQMPRYGFTDNTLGNNNLRNELTKELELGTEMRFFNDRLGIDFSFYRKNTRNQILSLGLPRESGVTAKQFNAGNIRNQGIEILLTGTPIKTKNLEWTSSINFARNKNMILSLAPGVDSYTLGYAFGADMTSVAIAGEEYGSIYTSYGYASYQATDAAGNNIDSPNNGKKMLKANGSFFRSGDAGQGNKILGSMMEKFNASSINNIRFKNFNLGFQIDAKVGGLMASGTHQYGSNFGAFESTLFGRSADFGGLPRKDASGAVIANDGIIPDGVFAKGTIINNINVGGLTFQEAADKGYVQPVSARIYYARLTQWSTGIREYSTFENSWVALREVSLGYTLPKKFTDKINFKQVNVGVTARNLMYIYNSLPDHLNPEGLFNNSAGAFAEYGGMPYVRTFAFSVRAAL
ncbi:SusC/RagA family TonB-linked outer membrane protein [Pedobacter psychrodurus]|uniref:SusC/RagA family TonB-linked outer membrane protein n=1 Tax=Pedobacter psychrodurus TaxID=2530456 RepID=A0A4V2MQX5_9SPHI|nr:SusC/RagA family TonB-linked outer membrane protein [Pedobacter psychrodurus]TCD26769.1 SusC/RagA family TonB-linked outer membrane protein [Pedobacter psychrodurus]